MKKRLLCTVSRLALRQLKWGVVAIALLMPVMPVFAGDDRNPGNAFDAAVAEQSTADNKREPSAELPPDWVLAHGPYTHWYPDTTQLVKNRSTPGNEKAWKDVIGTREFDTKGIAVRWDGKVLNLAIFTNFPDRNVMAAGRTVAPADLALDLDGNGTLETGVVLSGVRSAGDRGVQRPPDIQKGSAYRVSKWLRPDDILQHTYGQGWRWIGLTGQELAYAAVPVWIGGGTKRDDLAVTVDWRVNGRGSDYVVLVTLTKTTGDGEIWNLPVIWGTAVCGNDVVFAPVARIGNLLDNIGDRDETAENDGEDPNTGEDAAATDDVSYGEDEVDVADADVVDDEGLSVSTEGAESDGSVGGNGEIITEGVSEGSDETTPSWNDSYPVAFPDTTGEGGTGGSGGGGSGGSATAGGSGGGTSSGGSGSGGSNGGGTPSGGGGTTAGGSGGGGAENPLEPGGGEGGGAEGGGGEGGSGEEGGGGTEHATQIAEPPVTWLFGAAIAGCAAVLTRRRKRRKP